MHYKAACKLKITIDKMSTSDDGKTLPIYIANIRDLLNAVGSSVSMAEFFYFAFLEKLIIGFDFIIRFFFKKFNPRKIIDKML